MAGPWKDQWPLTASPSLYLDGQNKYNTFHDVGVLFQPLFLNLFTHIFEYFRRTALIKN